MKLRNKKTGEIGSLKPYGGEDGRIWVWIDRLSRPEYRYNSLAELNKDWEDVPEEPKEHFVITCDGKIITTAEEFDAIDECEEIGDYFETKEEAEKAVEKLKAWKRLKDKGFRFRGWSVAVDGKGIDIFANYPSETRTDLNLLFRGEE